MGKCHGITFVRWIVKHLGSYMAAAQQDNRLISWLSEPYRTISLFLTLIPFSLDTRLRLVHPFTEHSVNTYPVNTTQKKHTIVALWNYTVILSSTERTRNSQPIPDKYTVTKSLFGDSFSNLFQLKRSPSPPERTQQLTLQKIPLKGHKFLFFFGPIVHRTYFNPLFFTILLASRNLSELLFPGGCACKI